MANAVDSILFFYKFIFSLSYSTMCTSFLCVVLIEFFVQQQIFEEERIANFLIFVEEAFRVNGFESNPFLNDFQ